MSADYTLENWAHVGEIVGALASLITAIVAILALIFAGRQLKQAREAAAKVSQDGALADANAIYRSLLEQALKYPEFIAPDIDAVKTAAQTFDGNLKEFRRYEAFVDLMLTTFQEMRSASAKIDSSTHAYMIEWVACHRSYLDSDYFRTNFSKHLSGDLKQLVQEGIDFDKQRSAKGTKSKAA